MNEAQSSGRAARRNLAAIVDRIALETPTPAGGSAAASSVAQAIALLHKIALITARRGDSPDLERSRQALTAFAARAVACFEEDAEAFRSVLASKRTGGDSDAAWIQATEAPLQLAAIATEAATVFQEACPRTSPALALDRSAGNILLRAGVDISLANAAQNATFVRAPGERERLLRAVEATRAGARAALEKRGDGPDSNDER